MATYDPIIQELERELINLTTLWQAVSMRQVRVTQHPPGATPVDITADYATSPAVVSATTRRTGEASTL
jgi:hypothetical protein